MKNNRERILQEAGVLISKRGFANFSYADLANIIGIKKASIHYYFPSKEHLGIAYCEKLHSFFSNLTEQIKEQVSYKDKLASFLDVFSKYSKDHRMCPLYAMMTDFNMLSKKLQNKLQEVLNLEFSILEKIIENGKKSAEFSFNDDGKNLSCIIYNLLKGTLMMQYIDSSGIRFAEVKNIIARLLNTSNSK